jgi:hypothetical protein
MVGRALGTKMTSHFSREPGHAGALQEDEDLRHRVRRSSVGRGLVTEHVHGQAGIEIELVEKEVIGVDGRDVVWLEGWLGEVAEVEGDDDFGMRLRRSSAKTSADQSGRYAEASARRSSVSHR